MRKLVTLLLAMLLVLSLMGCGRISSSCEITCDTSQVYSKEESYEAIDVVKEYFRREFDGCTLLSIGYLGDDKRSYMTSFAKQYDVAEAIVLVSEFETGSSGGDGSLNPNDTYRNYRWVLVRNGSGSWEHKTHGYG